MITRFRLKNFKAHRDTDLALHQLTVLVGDNGSGKTCVLEALHVMDALRALPHLQVERGLVELVRHGANEMKLFWEAQARRERSAASLAINVSRGELVGLSLTGQDTSGALDDGIQGRRALDRV